MAEPLAALVQTAAHDAVSVLRRAREEIDLLDATDAGMEARWGLVELAADRLALAAKDAACPVALSVLLLDWRDRLSSHVLVARALAEMEVHPDLADQLLRRGLDELLGEAPQRLLDLRVNPAAVSARGE